MTTYLHWGAQADGTAGHVGGTPRLPAGTAVPACRLCDAPQTFFFQLTFPAKHAWRGWDVALFACVDCVDGDRLIPDMIEGLRGAKVNAAFLRDYQKNFRALAFETGTAREVPGYVERVARQPLGFSRRAKGAIGLCGGAPKWVLEDESPSTIAGAPALFLFQLFEELHFPTVTSAPGQMRLGLAPPPRRAAPGAYELFLANELYFFGPEAPGDQVYILTQTD